MSTLRLHLNLPSYFVRARTIAARNRVVFVRLNTTKTGWSARYSKETNLDDILRVDHAGEVAANYIYKGQMSVLGNDSCRAVLQVGLAVIPCGSHNLKFDVGDVGSGETAPSDHG
jgi:hypothetical protein